MLSADIIITGSALIAAEISEINGDAGTSRNLSNVLMPISEIKDAIDPNKHDEKKPTDNNK